MSKEFPFQQPPKDNKENTDQLKTRRQNPGPSPLFTQSVMERIRQQTQDRESPGELYSNN